MPMYEKFSKYYDLMYSEYDYANECDYLEEIFSTYKTQDIRSVLDVGCGTGSHAIELARRNFQVTGIDISEEQIRHAKRKTEVIPAENLHFEVADMRELNLDDQFDAATSFFGSIGYLIEDNDIRRAFKGISRHLKKGGLWVFEFWNIRAVKPSHSSWLRTEKDALKAIRLDTAEFDPKNCTLTILFDTYIISEEKILDQFVESHIIRSFSVNEIRTFLKDAGFEPLEFFHQHSFEPPKVDSFRVMSVARKA